MLEKFRLLYNHITLYTFKIVFEFQLLRFIGDNYLYIEGIVSLCFNLMDRIIRRVHHTIFTC